MGIFSFRNKEEKEAQEQRFRQKVEEQLLQLLDKKEEERSLLENLSQEIRQNSADIRRHDMSLEDCLEMLEEQQEEEKQDRKQVKEFEEERAGLLKLIEVYQEQMWNMRRYAAEHDPAWMPQLELSSEAVKRKEDLCGVVRIEETGGRVDYELHEVIEVRETAQEEQAHTVAQVCQPGYIYRGKVRRKAKVIACRFEGGKVS